MKIHIKDNRPCILEYETLVAQAVKVYSVQFEFENEWANFVKTAVFRVGDQSWEQMLVEDACIIPWEVLEKVGRLYISVYGINGDIRRPTTETEGVPIRAGAEPGDEAKEPTPDKYSQLLNALGNKQDKLTGLPGQVVGFDKDGNAVAQEPTGGGGGGSAVLYPATATRLGGIKVGTNLLVAADGTLSVDTASAAEADNTKPITSAAVHTQIGNIEVLLASI